MNSDTLDLLKTTLTVLGGVAAAVLAGKFTRKSQKESGQITLLTNLIDQLQEERDKAKEDAKQVPLWRRYAQSLRSQIYKLGGTPHDPGADLEL